MKKITKLTEEQESKIAEYREKWIKNGFRTDPITFETAVSECKWVYNQFLKEHSPEPVVFLVASPLQALVVANAVCKIIENKETGKDSQLGSQLRSQLDSQLRSQLYSQKLNWKYYTAQAWCWSGYYGFYDFILEVLLPQEKSKFELFDRWRESLQRINWMIPLTGVCIAVQRPTELYFGEPDTTGLRRLHKDGGMAVRFEDGWGLHALNGIRVPAWAAETPATEITKEQITKETNADIRREVIRKIGSSQLLKILDYKVIDTMDGYELISFDIGDGRVRPFLKMQNPSMDLTHVEGVRPDITTVKEAICYPNGLKTYTAPLALS